MNFNGVKCDECGRIKGEPNHWHELHVWYYDSGEVRISIGFLGGLSVGSNGIESGELHDLCGEACFYKHLGKLLKMNPVVADAE